MRTDPSLISNVSYERASVKLHSVAFKRNFVLSHTKPRESTASVTTSFPVVSTPDDIDRSIRGINRMWVDEWKHTPERDDKDSRPWRHSYLPTTRLYTGNRPEISGLSYGGIEAVAAEEALDKTFATALQSLWSTRYGNILRRVREIQQEALQSIFLDVLTPNTEKSSRHASARGEAPALDADRAFERMSSFLKRQSDRRVQQALGSKDQFMRRYNQDSALRQIVNHIDAVEAQIELEMQPIQQLSSLVRRLFLQGKALSFEGPRISVVTESDTEIGLERLSSGEKHLLQILLVALGAEESTMLIDEPELSMHIDWQRELVRNIRSLIRIAS
jgi:hypothetical protein